MHIHKTAIPVLGDDIVPRFDLATEVIVLHTADKTNLQEKRSIVSVFSTILIFAVYSIYIYLTYMDGNLNLSSDFSFWGSVFLVLIPVMIVAKIIIHIAFNVINKIATNEDEPSITDELDKLIELKSTRNSYYSFMLGMLLSMTTLVMGMPPMAMFIAIIFSMMGSCLINDISQLYFYRRGF